MTRLSVILDLVFGHENRGARAALADTFDAALPHFSTAPYQDLRSPSARNVSKAADVPLYTAAAFVIGLRGLVSGGGMWVELRSLALEIPTLRDLLQLVCEDERRPEWNIVELGFREVERPVFLIAHADPSSLELRDVGISRALAIALVAGARYLLAKGEMRVGEEIFGLK